MKNKILQKKEGSATVEASLVMSFVIIIIFGFITFSMNLAEETKTYIESQEVAIKKESISRKIPRLMRIGEIFTEDEEDGN